LLVFRDRAAGSRSAAGTAWVWEEVAVVEEVKE
jgi:hypothetical protein